MVSSSVKFRSNKKRLLWGLYFAFIITMPNDVFELTSILTLEQPASVQNYRLYEFYLSVLYFPLILYGMLKALKPSKYIQNKPIKLIALLFIKDIFVISIARRGMVEAYWFVTYADYLLAIFYFITVVSVYKNRIDEFLMLYACVNVATLLFSFVTGFGQGFEVGRSHMAALQTGETAVVLSILCLYFAFQKNRINVIFILAGCLLIIMTGNRKDVVYVLICVIVYYFRRHHVYRRVGKKKIIVGILIGIAAIVALVVFGGRFSQNLDLSRYTDMLASIAQDGFVHFLTNDSSFIGRMASLIAGGQIVKESPIMGGMFSVIDVQRQMQMLGYPTFPHSTVLYLYCIMGILVLIPVYLYVRNGVKLIKLNHPLQYVYIYIFIRDTISGGANESVKYLLLMLIILNYGTLAFKRMESIKRNSKEMVLNDKQGKRTGA